MSVSEPPALPVAVPPPRGSKKTIVIAVIVVIVAFVSGAVGGVLLERVHMMRRHGRMPRMMIRHLDHTLNLTPDQHAKVEAIVMRHHQRIAAISDSVRPRMRQELEAANREIEAVLTPEQREKFEKMRLRLGRREGRSRTEPTR